ncbi:hypothetical protein EMCRGX_G020320 [Ephydatia muelleri]
MPVSFKKTGALASSPTRVQAEKLDTIGNSSTTLIFMICPATRLKMKTYHLIRLLAMAGLSSCVLQVVPYSEVITYGNLQSFTIFTCIVRPPQYTATWLHAGTALSSMGRYSISNGSVFNDTTYGSILQIQLLRYSDAGNYTCMIQPSPANGSESYSATIQLILLVKLEVLGPTSITVNATTTSQVELSCEMSQYIHPDGDLRWFRGGQKLDNTQSKYSIGYRNGTKLALNGGSDVTSSKVSVLTISQLTSSDSGVYTCKVFGTDQSGDVNLMVVGVKLEVLGPTSITVNATTTSQVELSCEMSQYIHPDRDLWWFRGGQKLDNTQSKYSIGYRNGTKLALNGGSDVISSRVSVLTISQLTSSDSGVFTCKVFGTDQSGDVCLTVVDGIPTPQPLSTDIVTAVGVSVSVTFVMSFSMGVLVASVLCYISRRSKESSHKPSSQVDPSTEYKEVGTNGNVNREIGANVGSHAMEMDASIAYGSHE